MKMDRRRILIVEDSPTMRQLLVFALRRLENVDIVTMKIGYSNTRLPSTYFCSRIKVGPESMNSETWTMSSPNSLHDCSLSFPRPHRPKPISTR